MLTCTIGFEEAGFDEATYDRVLAAHLGTEHTETRLNSVDARALIPQLPQLYTEPFADPPSCSPTWCALKPAAPAHRGPQWS